MKVSLVKPDRRHIDLRDPATAQRWTKKFGVTREALDAAVERVGNNIESLRRELGAE
jgi:uncharacterized protein DUF3606